jgi:predicted DNA-binding transcriptional regulator YafY
LPDRITKVQRWLDLIAYLVGRRLPVSVGELMERLPAYAEPWAQGDEKARKSVRRKFERDKDELRELGIPIETVPYRVGPLGEEVTGYRIRRKDFYLPYLKLLAQAGEEEKKEGGGVGNQDGGPGFPTPPEPGRAPGASDTIEVRREEATRALRGLRALADLPAFPLAAAARSAYRKLTFDLDPQLEAGGPEEEEWDPAGVASPDASREGGRRRKDEQILFAVSPAAARAREHLDVLSSALHARKQVSFRYHAMGRDEVADREVHPYGLLFQHSRWYLVGWDLSREAERMFRVDRMEGVEANRFTPNTPDYELPEGPILEKYRNREAWELGEPDETVRARARFRFPTSLWAQRNRFGTLVEEGPDGDALREFQVREPHAFLRWILSLAGEADIESPPELRGKLRTMAREVAELYEGDGVEDPTGETEPGANPMPTEDPDA